MNAKQRITRKVVSLSFMHFYGFALFSLCYAKKVVSAISGWDQIRFRGTIRWLANTAGINSYLSTRNILLKDFEKWAEELIEKEHRTEWPQLLEELVSRNCLDFNTVLSDSLWSTTGPPMKPNGRPTSPSILRRISTSCAMPSVGKAKMPHNARSRAGRFPVGFGYSRHTV